MRLSLHQIFYTVLPLIVFILLTGSVNYLILSDIELPLSEIPYELLMIWYSLLTYIPVAYFSIPALAGCLVTGIIWFKSSGWKRYCYYAILLFFGIMLGYGSICAEFMTSGGFRMDIPKDPIAVLYPFWFILLAGFAALLIILAIPSRKR